MELRGISPRPGGFRLGPWPISTRDTVSLNTISYGYDSVGNVTSFTLPAPQGGRSFGYDAAGRSPPPPTAGDTARYSYDGDDRVTQVTYSADGGCGVKTAVTGSVTQSWTYDKGGNRLTAAKTGAATVYYAYNAADELCWSSTTAGTACANPPAGATTYAYDATGNMGA